MPQRRKPRAKTVVLTGADMQGVLDALTATGTTAATPTQTPAEATTETPAGKSGPVPAPAPAPTIGADVSLSDIESEVGTTLEEQKKRLKQIQKAQWELTQDLIEVKATDKQALELIKTKQAFLKEAEASIRFNLKMFHDKRLLQGADGLDRVHIIIEDLTELTPCVIGDL